MGRISKRMGASILFTNAMFVIFTAHVQAISYSGTDAFGNYNASQEDRFYGSTTNYIANDLDLSGVGNAPGAGNSGLGYAVYATLISDEYFISAAHVANGNPYSSVTFYQGNGTPTAQQSVAIDTSFGVQLGSDLWLGKLSSPAPSWAKIYPVLSRDENTNYLSYLPNKKITLVGYRGGGSSYAPYNVGFNDIDAAYSDVYSWVYKNGVTYGANEARVIGGDSSGPSFVKISTGVYAIAGTHWQGDAFFSYPYSDNIDSSVSAHISEIKSYVPSVQVATDILGDLNGDYKVDFADTLLMSPNYNSGPGKTYNDGDLNGDGYVNSADVLLFSPNYGHDVLAPSDLNKDGTVDATDMKMIGAHWHTSVTAHTNGDADGSGYVDGHDVDMMTSNWLYSLVRTWPSTGTYSDADTDSSGAIDVADLHTLLSHWGTTAGGKAAGDLNLDGIVDSADFDIMASWYGHGVASYYVAPSVNLVPEPGTVVCVAQIVALLLFPAIRPRR